MQLLRVLGGPRLFRIGVRREQFPVNPLGPAAIKVVVCSRKPNPESVDIDQLALAKQGNNILDRIGLFP
jgi:hypothetical protein